MRNMIRLIDDVIFPHNMNHAIEEMIMAHSNIQVIFSILQTNPISKAMSLSWISEATRGVGYETFLVLITWAIMQPV